MKQERVSRVLFKKIKANVYNRNRDRDRDRDRDKLFSLIFIYLIINFYITFLF